MSYVSEGWLLRCVAVLAAIALALMGAHTAASACMCCEGNPCSFESRQVETAVDVAVDSCCAPAEPAARTREGAPCADTQFHGCCCAAHMPLPERVVMGPASNCTTPKLFFEFLLGEYPVEQGDGTWCSAGILRVWRTAPVGLPPPPYLLNCSLLI